VDGQVFAIWVDPKAERPAGHAAFVLDTIDGAEKLWRDAAADVQLCRSPGDLRQANASGRIGAILGVEGGHALEGDLGNLDRFSERGVRVLTITWNNSNELADSNADESRPHNGLSGLGRAAIRRMNELGMVVDLSHCSDKAFFDILDAAQAPAIASHSGVRARRNFHRNLTDEQIRALAASGGVLGMVFLPYFLRENEDEASVADVVESIDHVCQLVGPDSVGLGSDFDGFEGRLRGLEDVSLMPAVTAGLVARGYPAADIRKILGENFLRVWDSMTRSG
jgi:membrane dipeptidase